MRIESLVIVLSTAVVFGSLFIAKPVQASHSKTTCDNSCVMTNDGNGTITVEDCCGGRVTTVFPRHEMER